MIVHEYLRYLVIDTKIVTYEYFMDDIRDWEIKMLIPRAMDSHRTEWETSRYIAYHNALISGNMKRQYAQKPMTELFPLPYDETYKHVENEHVNRDITDKQVVGMRRRVSKVANILKNKNKQTTNGKHS